METTTRPVRQRFGLGNVWLAAGGAWREPPEDVHAADWASGSIGKVVRQFKVGVRPLRVYVGAEANLHSAVASLMRLRFGTRVVDFEAGISVRGIEAEQGLDIDLPDDFNVPAGTEIEVVLKNRDVGAGVGLSVSLLCEVLS